MKVRNTFIIFFVSGFWHGANWTFIVWGLLNAIYIMPSIIFNTNRDNLDIVARGKIFPTLKEFLLITITFGLTGFAWIFFRAANMRLAIDYISGIFSSSLFTIPTPVPFVLTIAIGLFVIIEWLGREQQYAIAQLEMKLPKAVRWATYYAIVLTILMSSGSEKQFIYFQF